MTLLHDTSPPSVIIFYLNKWTSFNLLSLFLFISLPFLLSVFHGRPDRAEQNNSRPMPPSFPSIQNQIRCPCLPIVQLLVPTVSPSPRARLEPPHSISHHRNQPRTQFSIPAGRHGRHDLATVAGSLKSISRLFSWCSGFLLMPWSSCALCFLYRSNRARTPSSILVRAAGSPSTPVA
jgi:hypothetical protein